MKKILLERFTGAEQVTPSSRGSDAMGIDYLIEFPTRWITVDVKIRDKDFAWERHRENRTWKLDVVLELWSVDKKKKGWPLDINKRCDYVMWFWKDSGRVLIRPFLPLFAALTANLDRWRSIYPPHFQETVDRGGPNGYGPNGYGPNGYKSEFICVPVDVLDAAITEQMGGFSQPVR